jgi:hypothetical protein
MFPLTLRERSRAAVLALFTVVGAGVAVVAASAEPALALCKYGGPHCANRYVGYDPRPKVKVPDDNGWVDPDCKYYGNCNSPNSARRVPGGK